MKIGAIKRGQPGWARTLVLTALFLAVVWTAFGQPFRQGPNRGTGAGRGRAMPAERNVPQWEMKPRFEKDVFTFARLEYQSRPRRGWHTDFPGADLNFSYRLQQLTSMKVNPDPVHFEITDPRLFEHPFVFMVDPRYLFLSDEEAQILRRYLLSGGFLMVDDFWGSQMWEHLMGEMEKVFPDRKPVSLPLEHPIFNTPFPLKTKPQVPSEDSAHDMRDQPDPYRTWEYEIREEPQPADYRAYFDDRGRMMMLICWNTDLSDGWEEEGISPWFFENFAEKLSFPFGINVVFHVMTH